MPPFRILAVQVAGLQEAVAEAIERFQTEVVGTAIAALRGELAPAVAAEVTQQLGTVHTGGSSTYRRATIDLGPLPTPEGWATVTDERITPTSSVLAWVAPTVPGKDDDETGMDVIDVWSTPGTGEVQFRVRGLTGFLAGKFSVDYLVTIGG